MRKLSIPLFAVLALSIMFIPSNAAWAYEDVDEIVDYWTDWAYDYGYEVVATEIGKVKEDQAASLVFNLDPGYYHIYVESLHGTDDIDLKVYNASAEIIASDEYPDNYPMVQVNMMSAGEITIEIVGFTYEVGSSTEFAVVIAYESEPISEDETEVVEEEIYVPTFQEDLDYVQQARAQYMDLLVEEDLENIFDEVNVVEGYGYKTYTITLGAGDYVVFAEGGLKIADVDLRIYDPEGILLCEDTETSVIGTCDFNVPKSGDYDLEIEAYDMVGDSDEGYFVIVVAR